MTRLLPLSFLLAVGSIFGLLWIMTSVDPDSAHFYIFIIFVGLLFSTVFNLLGLILYFIRTKIYKRYDANWYLKTSYKMAFFVALFVALAATLAILQLVNTFNIVLAISALILFATWSYLGRKS